MLKLPWFLLEVDFDDAHAEAAVDTLRRVRSRVTELAEVRAVAAREARDGWEGRYRDEFDVEHAATQRQLSAAIDRIDAVIAGIRRAQEAAADDRSLRNRLRLDHLLENAREEAAELLGLDDRG